MSEQDQGVPQTVNKEAMLRKWAAAIPEGLFSNETGVLPFADHVLTTEHCIRLFRVKVEKFLTELQVNAVEK